MHGHNFFELAYITGGTAEHTLENEGKTISAGDYFFVDYGCLHGFQNCKNLTLINCTVESLQGMCYIENLVMKNCRLINTTLAFEYSTVKAQIDSRIDSVLNPAGGTIRAQSIGELILEKDRIDPEKTVILCKGEPQA